MSVREPDLESWSTWIAVIPFLSLLVALVTASLLPAASGYEASIYRVYPWYFWVALVVAILSGQYVILRSARRTTASSGHWKLGFGAILLANTLLLSLPILRGYPTYGRADVLTHVGTIREIQATGAIPSDNFYPALHNIQVVASYATGQEVLRTVNLIPPIISLLAIVSLYLLLGQIFENRRRVLFSLLFTSVLLYQVAHVNVVPYSQSFLLLPFILYLIVKERRQSTLSTRAVLIVALVAIVTYHPLTSGFLILIILISIASRQEVQLDVRTVESSNIVFFSITAFIVWFQQFDGIFMRFGRVWRSFTRAGGESALDSYQGTVSRTTPQLPDMIEYVIYQYGLTAIFIGFGMAYITYLVFELRRSSSELNRYLTAFAVAFVTFLGLSALFFLSSFDVAFGFTRPLSFVLLFGSILTGSLFCIPFEEFDARRWRTGIKTLLYISLIIIVVLSTLTVYFSPYIFRMNSQVTDMELEGSEWLSEQKDRNKLVESFGISQERFHHAHSGTSAPMPGVREFGTGPPDHFNYTNSAQLGRSYENNTYLIISKVGRVLYEARFPDYRPLWRFTPEDFSKLERRDPSVSQIYDGGEVDVYYIRGTR